jgi:hypothetical protein
MTSPRKLIVSSPHSIISMQKSVIAKSHSITCTIQFVVLNSDRIISIRKALFSNSASNIAMIYIISDHDESHEIAESEMKFDWIRLLIIRSPLNCMRLTGRDCPSHSAKCSASNTFVAQFRKQGYDCCPALIVSLNERWFKCACISVESILAEWHFPNLREFEGGRSGCRWIRTGKSVEMKEKGFLLLSHSSLTTPWQFYVCITESPIYQVSQLQTVDRIANGLWLKQEGRGYE